MHISDIHNHQNIIQDRNHYVNDPAQFLSPGKKEFLETNGYVVIENAANLEQCANSINAICQFLEISRVEPDTWYKDAPLSKIGLMPLHQHPAFWDIRQSPAIYNIFSEILDEKELWVTMDRASFRPPCRYDLENYGSDLNPIHWDYDFRLKNKSLYQGLIYLNDTNKEQGAFACIPSIYKQIKTGSFKNIEALNKFHKKGLFLSDVIPDCKEPVLAIDAPAGSLIIWDARLPHGCVNNHYHEPRFVQFISMFKANDDNAVPNDIIQTREDRIACYEQMQAPGCHRNRAGQFNLEPYEKAILSSLGKKLLGLTDWT
jgi:hypothetical protein